MSDLDTLAKARDETFMRRAIDIARAAAGADGAAPIGCVIVYDGRVVAEASNQVGPMRDPTAHAEIVAIRDAALSIGPDLRGATLYSTLQPCGMCSMASIWAHVDRIVFSAGRHQVHRMYFEDRHLDTMDFIHDAFRDDLRLDGGVLADESVSLYHRPGDAVPTEQQGNT